MHSNGYSHYTHIKCIVQSSNINSISTGDIEREKEEEPTIPSNEIQVLQTKYDALNMAIKFHLKLDSIFNDRQYDIVRRYVIVSYTIQCVRYGM